ncbi:MAG TPA: LPXTG cell wall anchor domain-containing protein [Jatrophihabitantaceae bacterium]|nr:LPXTG cell wall anchor domain-containing protein [Jatrophihabitantaceae bacterium]
MRARHIAPRLLKFVVAAGLGLALALLVAPSAQAATLPALTVQPYIDVSNGFEPTTITISGTDCVPKPGMPASVTLTVDNIDGVFTATPAADGTWSIDVLISTEDAGAIHAACDNYLGSTSYPEGFVGFVAAGSAEQTSQPSAGGDLANTGSQSGSHLTLAAVLLAVGAALTWIGRRGVRRLT